MNMPQEKIEIIEPIKGFTEREKNSKALLNTDMNSLLKYKIQRRKFLEINKSNGEVQSMKQEIDELKDDLNEIKILLKQIVNKGA
jgi:hypothetical protein